MMHAANPAYAPFFDDIEAIRLAVTETGLPEAKVQAVVEAQAWYLSCAGVMDFEGADSEARIAGYLARYPNMFRDRDKDLPTMTYADEARFIAETTGIFEDETTRILASVRAYEESLGITEPGDAEDYRAWRIAWLTHELRVLFVYVDGRMEVHSFVDALRREREQSPG